MRPVKSYIAKRFQNSDAGLSLDTDALARYSDIKMEALTELES